MVIGLLKSSAILYIKFKQRYKLTSCNFMNTVFIKSFICNTPVVTSGLWDPDISLISCTNSYSFNPLGQSTFKLTPGKHVPVIYLMKDCFLISYPESKLLWGSPDPMFQVHYIFTITGSSKYRYNKAAFSRVMEESKNEPRIGKMANE